MKFVNLALVVVCAVAYTAAQAEFETEIEDLQEPYIPIRFRRSPGDPQRGSVIVEVQKPLSGPDRRPSVNIDYNHRLYERNGGSASAYGGLNITPGQRAQPHIGIKAERTYRNGFINAFGQAERGANGRPSPSFGIGGGFRFRRDADFESEEQQQY